MGQDEVCKGVNPPAVSGTLSLQHGDPPGEGRGMLVEGGGDLTWQDCCCRHGWARRGTKKPPLWDETGMLSGVGGLPSTPQPCSFAEGSRGGNACSGMGPAAWFFVLLVTGTAGCPGLCSSCCLTARIVM